jgi:hypothetical protein
MYCLYGEVKLAVNLAAGVSLADKAIVLVIGSLAYIISDWFTGLIYELPRQFSSITNAPYRCLSKG